jgi:hypothetical protein
MSSRPSDLDNEACEPCALWMIPADSVAAWSAQIEAAATQE